MTTKTVSAMIAAAVVAGMVTYFVQQQTVSQLRADNQRLELAQQALNKERDDALAATTATAEELKRREGDKAELLRLRGEIAQLRQAAAGTEQLARQLRSLQESYNRLAQRVPQSQPEPEADAEKHFAIERMNQSRQLMLALILYAGDNEDRWPTELNAVTNYLGEAAGDLLNNHPFELVLQGKVTDVSKPAETIALRSKTPFVVNGKSVKAYGFADGHGEIKPEPPEGFEAWEKAHMMAADPGR